MPENLLPIITLPYAPPPSLFFSSFFFEFVIREFEVKRVCIDVQTLDGILLIWWYEFNEFQEQDEVEDSD